MTPEELQCLATYRKHKKCQCVDCREARIVLSEYDSQPRVSGILGIAEHHDSGSNVTDEY
jgi:hypothetical protein